MHRVITIMPEPGMGDYAWGKDSDDPSDRYVGRDIADAVSGFAPEYGVPKALQKRLSDWMLRFEHEHFCDKPEFDWASFHRDGLALAKDLKRALGDGFTVVYRKPCEDPTSRDHERVVVD